QLRTVQGPRQRRRRGFLRPRRRIPLRPAGNGHPRPGGPGRSRGAISFGHITRGSDSRGAVGQADQGIRKATTKVAVPATAVRVRRWFHAVHGVRYWAQAWAAPGPFGSTRARASLWGT